MQTTEQDAPVKGAARRDRTRWRVSRRDAIALLGGLGAASIAVVVVGPARRLLAEPERPFPAWVYTMPRGGEAYAAAYANLELMETLPCFCGCMRFETDPHASLRTCFQSAAGEIDPHGAFCETCQDEAIEAADLASQGVAWNEIHGLIVAKYEGHDPMAGGAGCGSASGDEHAEGAACAP
jgi:hypothetical protein